MIENWERKLKFKLLLKRSHIKIWNQVIVQRLHSPIISRRNLRVFLVGKNFSQRKETQILMEEAKFEILFNKLKYGHLLEILLMNFTKTKKHSRDLIIAFSNLAINWSKQQDLVIKNHNFLKKKHKSWMRLNSNVKF